MGRLHVRVQPGARRTGFAGWFGDLPKMTVAAPPVEGAANEELIKQIAKIFGIRPRHVHLVGGATSRSKRFDLDGVSDDEIAAVVERLNPS